VEAPIRQAQVVDDLAGNPAGGLVVHAAAIARPRDDALDDEFDVEMQRLLVVHTALHLRERNRNRF
jgi:hypothetical protein